jgi:hypothetical protein
MPGVAVPEWESEAMAAYKWQSAADRAAAERAAAAAAKARKARAGRPPRKVRKALADRPDGDGDDWVLVQTSDKPVRVDGVRTVMAVPPELAGAAVMEVGRRYAAVPAVTRDLCDTTFNRVFKRPLPHNFGRGNTRPVNDENYLRSFNVRAGDQEPGGAPQVFDCVARAQVFHETLRASEYQIFDVLDDLEEAERGEEAEASLPVLAEQAPPAPLPPAAPTGPPKHPDVFGAASKPRSAEPSMFEILSWPAQ